MATANTVGELIDILEDYGDHVGVAIEVVIEDRDHVYNGVLIEDETLDGGRLVFRPTDA